MTQQLFPTLRAALEAALGPSAHKVRGAAEVIQSEDGYRPPMEGTWTAGRAVLSEKGVPFVVCSGEVVMSWHQERNGRTTVYLVRDSEEYDQWMRQRWLDIHTGTKVAQGSAPAVFYKFVKSL